MLFDKLRGDNLSQYGNIIIFSDNDKDNGQQLFYNVSKWLSIWQKWYFENVILEPSDYIHLYSRGIHLYGLDVSKTEDLKVLIRESQALGIVLSITMELSDLIKNHTAVTNLKELSGIGRIYLGSKNTTPCDNNVVSSIVESVFKIGATMTLRGLPSTWEELGVLNSSTVNGGSFRIVPYSVGSEREYDAIYINSKGDIYTNLKRLTDKLSPLDNISNMI